MPIRCLGRRGPGGRGRVFIGVMAEITQILEAVGSGAAKAEELLPLVYDELRRVAAARLAQERPGQTLQATALVHEAWLRVTTTAQPQWRGHEHFFRVAAETMRRILVDRARRRRVRHGGEWERVGGRLQLRLPLN
jgi:RNA polymerase sigma factor (TIGR02999 family)